MAGRAEAAGHLERARGLAFELVERLLDDLLAVDAGRGRDLSARALQLEQAELPSIVLLAALKARSDPNAAAEAARDAVRTDELVRPVDRAELRRKLRESSAGQLVENYVNRQPHISPRTRYNLACYYTTLAKRARAREIRRSCYDRALVELDLALESVGLAAWAQDDPSLEPLQEARAEGFRRVIARHTAAPHAVIEESEDQKPEQEEADKPAAPRRRWREERLIRSFFRWLERESDVRLTRLKATGSHPGFDFAVLGDDERLLVDVRPSEEPVGTNVIERLVAARSTWVEETPGTRIRLALVVGDGTDVGPEALKLAREKQVEVYEVGARGRVRRLG